MSSRTPAICRWRRLHQASELAALAPGSVVTGQVQDLPIPAPVLRLEVMRVDAEGAGLRFLQDD